MLDEAGVYLHLRFVWVDGSRDIRHASPEPDSVGSYGVACVGEIEFEGGFETMKSNCLSVPLAFL